VLDITMDSVRAKIMSAAANGVAALSLGIGYPNAASAPHMIMNAFKNALAIAAVTDITFKEAEKTKAYLKDPSAFAAAAPAGGAAAGGKPAAAAAAPKKEEVKEESEEEAMEMGLFD
jgi:large subunit ribosomal protein LP0